MAETNTPPGHATTLIRTLVVTQQGSDPFLLVEVEIACPTCGEGKYQILGHHLKSLSEHFARIVAEHPELCGKLGRTLDRVEWAGGVDPGKVGMN